MLYSHKPCLKSIVLLLMSAVVLNSYGQKIIIKRLTDKPIISADMLMDGDGENINGPSLIKVPSWVKSPLGKYYLYFADHHGKYIRLAYSDNLKGPWKIYQPGALRTNDISLIYPKATINHIASPDVVIDNKKQQIILYFHLSSTIAIDSTKHIPQVTLRAASKNGINFEPEKEILGEPYFRVFNWKGQLYAMATGGNLYRSTGNGTFKFIKGPNPFLSIQNPTKIRHVALYLKKDALYAFYSRIGDLGEHILMSKIKLTNNWNSWQASQPVSVLKPEYKYEGADLPLLKSVSGYAKKPVNELRDPAIFKENKKLYLLYSVAGESGIGIAEMVLPRAN